MKNQFAVTLIFLLGIIFLLSFLEIIYRRFEIKAEYTRKIAHFIATSSTLSFPFLIRDHWYLLFLALVFFLILFISKRTSHLKSIHSINRESAGSYLLPIAIYLTFLISNKMNSLIMYILPISILAVSDPLAGIIGMYSRRRNHEIILFSLQLEKTILGSAAFFLSSFIISLLVFYAFEQIHSLKTILFCLLVAIIITIIEFLSPKGIDNLIIPLGVILILILYY